MMSWLLNEPALIFRQNRFEVILDTVTILTVHVYF